MSLEAFIEKIDDRLNPIVVKELRQAFQGRWVAGAFICFLTLQVTVLGSLLMSLEPIEQDSPETYAGRHVFSVLQGILLTACLLFVPAYAGVRLAAERNDADVDLLFISALTPRAIVWGKLGAASVLTLMIFSACAPFMVFTYLLRGIDLPTIVLVLLIDLAAIVVTTQLAIFAALSAGNRLLRGLIGVLATVVLAGVLAGTLASTSTLARRGLPFFEPEFWGVLLLCTCLSFIAVWLLVVATAAAIGPTAQRRDMVGIAGLAVWLLTGVPAVAASYAGASEVPVILWLFLSPLPFVVNNIAVRCRAIWRRLEADRAGMLSKNVRMGDAT